MTWNDPARTDLDAYEHQRRTFERTAEQYARRRPSYPDELFRGMRAYAALGAHERILELGCGPGIATAPVAAWGNPILCVEPAPGMVSVAANNLAAFGNVEFVTSTFERWELEPGAFGLVFVAQAYHWLDPKTRIARIGAALRPGGAAAVVWNEQVTPRDHSTFFERVQTVYREHAPHLAHQRPFRETPREGHVLEGAEGFDDLERRHYPWRWTLDADAYVALMSTHSPHAALDDDVRARLLDGIAHLIDAEFGGKVTEHYVAVLHLARRAVGAG